MAFDPYNPAVRQLVKEVTDELENNILPFWKWHMYNRDTWSYYGRIDGTGKVDRSAPIGAIMTARILWTFAAAYRVTGNERYMLRARSAQIMLVNYFYDNTYSGVFWSIDGRYNKPVDEKKQIYALSFVIYGMAEMYRATGNEEALWYAKRLFKEIEKHSLDRERGGYLEAFTRSWGEIADMRLSDKDENERKTMNTHLHILEAYTALYRVTDDPEVGKQIRNLINIFTDKILDPATGHLRLFFDDDWNSKRDIVSYGHEIETSWLLHEAALVLGDPELTAKVEPVVKLIAKASREGLNSDGSMIYEKIADRGTVDTDRHWWVQAENIVGNINLYQHFGDEEALQRALDCWEFVKADIVDRAGGEWFWSVAADGTPNTAADKGGFWKCPYHNGRMCLEIIERAATRGGMARG